MRLIAISDLHGELPLIKGSGELLAIAGDVCPIWEHDLDFQRRWLAEEFRPWLEGMLAQFDLIIWIAGNHDLILQEEPPPFEHERIIYLEDAAHEIGGIQIYGTPWSISGTQSWAFDLPPEEVASTPEAQSRYARIPESTDILITHGPAYRACDKTKRGSHVGSRALRERLLEVQPQLVICGHIHEANGASFLGDTRIHNVSLMDVRYRPVHSPRRLGVDSRPERRIATAAGDRGQ